MASYHHPTHTLISQPNRLPRLNLALLSTALWPLAKAQVPVGRNPYFDDANRTFRLGVGAIIGIVVGVIVFKIILITAIVMMVRRRRRRTGAALPNFFGNQNSQYTNNQAHPQQQSGPYALNQHQHQFGSYNQPSGSLYPQQPYPQPNPPYEPHAGPPPQYEKGLGQQTDPTMLPPVHSKERRL